MRPLIVDRELRIAVGGTMLIALSLAAALAVPLWQLALGPILWGTLHVLADFRYLVARPGLHRRIAWLAVVVPGCIAVGVVGSAWIGFATAALAALFAGAAWSRRVLVAGLLVGAAIAFAAVGTLGDIVFAHLHNLVALVAWLWWRRRRGSLHLVPLLAFVAGVCVLASGAATPASWSLEFGPAGLAVGRHLASLAPDVAAPWDVRLVLLFAFAQSVHYAVWVRLIPEEDRGRETPRSYGATVRELRRDLGSWVMWGLVLASVVIGAWAMLDLAAARFGYLRAVLFHGHLEVAALSFLWLERWSGSGSKRSS